MQGHVVIEARWDAEAGVWLATSPEVPGLIVEAGTWTGMIEETESVLPDLLDVQGRSGVITLTFRAEEHRDAGSCDHSSFDQKLAYGQRGSGAGRPA